MNRFSLWPKPAANIRLRAVALPAEHGGWSFLFEPIVLGLLVAPSLPGLCLGFGMVFAFLTRHPLKLALNDRRRGKRLARTPVAEQFTLLYAILSGLSFVLAFASGSGVPLLPLVIAAPLFALQAYFDATARSRAAAAELIGALALAASAAGIALAGGWSAERAGALWLLLAARALPAILYVRARLRLERDQPFSRWLPLVAHALGLLVVLALAAAALIPAPSAAAFALLLARALYGLSPYRRGHSAKQIGLQELLLGILFVGLVALGYAAASP